MISRDEALIIAHEYCKGDVVKEDCTSVIKSQTMFPYCFNIIVYHRDEDKNVYRSEFEILAHNGYVSHWEEKLIKDGEMD